MEILKKAIRKAAIGSSIRSVKEILDEFIERSDEEIADFSGSVADLVLAQSVRILREKKACGGPETIEEFNLLIELVKSLEEVKEDEHKQVFCRTTSPRK